MEEIPKLSFIAYLKRNGYEYDILGQGYGIKDNTGQFVRVKPFWISFKELEEINKNQ